MSSIGATRTLLFGESSPLLGGCLPRRSLRSSSLSAGRAMPMAEFAYKSATFRDDALVSVLAVGVT